MRGLLILAFIFLTTNLFAGTWVNSNFPPKNISTYNGVIQFQLQDDPNPGRYYNISGLTNGAAGSDFANILAVLLTAKSLGSPVSICMEGVKSGSIYWCSGVQFNNN